ESMLRARSVTSGAQRLAGLLLELADSELQTAMTLTQEELASLTGASRATVTRALSNWRRRGIIRTGQRDITITDLRALGKTAGQQPSRPGGSRLARAGTPRAERGGGAGRRAQRPLAGRDQAQHEDHPAHRGQQQPVGVAGRDEPGPEW